MQVVHYYIFLFFVYLFRLLPFPVIYVFGRFFSFLAYYVIKYRRKVVLDNLRKAYPNKTSEEIAILEKKFYHHFGNIMVESIKGFSMSEKSIIKRHKIVNPEVLDYYFDKGKSVIGAIAHYGNWEWGSLSGGLQTKHQVVALYMPLTNKRINNYLMKTRSKYNTELASVKNTFEIFHRKRDKPCAFLMVSDQCPSRIDNSYWINFLGIETDFLHGIEKYAKMCDVPVVFVDIVPVKRGHYIMELTTLAENPKDFPDGEITRLYAEKLEQRIKTNPEYWLWSHRRWKHKKPED